MVWVLLPTARMKSIVRAEPSLRLQIPATPAQQPGVAAPAPYVSPWARLGQFLATEPGRRVHTILSIVALVGPPILGFWIGHQLSQAQLDAYGPQASLGDAVLSGVGAGLKGAIASILGLYAGAFGGLAVKILGDASVVRATGEV